ncbi:hypothetical protein V1264_019451 [Littorina saxatilis]|uniref:Uncharacterized protein n=1 Tax=Littorina saxatilis TaxID=31220 RepID=A0AAN9BFF6_9CAEN
MDPVSRKRWWEHKGKVLVRMPDHFEVASPSNESLKWEDNMRNWPPVTYVKIVNYLMFSEGCDGEAMDNFKSMESYNYFQSRKVSAEDRRQASGFAPTPQ